LRVPPPAPRSPLWALAALMCLCAPLAPARAQEENEADEANLCEGDCTQGDDGADAESAAGGEESVGYNDGKGDAPLRELAAPALPELTTQRAPNDPRWGDHILEHTPLEVRPDGALRVRLSAPRAAAGALSETPAPAVFTVRLVVPPPPPAAPAPAAPAARPAPIDFSRVPINERLDSGVEKTEEAAEEEAPPAPLEGLTYWSAPDELSFKPREALELDETYEVTLTPSPALGHPADLTPFTFHVIATAARVRVEPLALRVSPTDPDRLELRSRLTLSERVAPSQVEEVIKALHEGVALPVRWEHDPKGLAHDFSVSVERYEAPSTLVLRANLYAAGGAGRYAERLKIPSLGAFTLTRAVAVSAPRQHARLYFSQPLDPRQDLAGLVHAPGVELDLAVSDQHLIVTPRAPVTGALDLTVEPALRDTRGAPLGATQRQAVNFAKVKPEIRAVGQGTILPNTQRPTMSFETVGLKSVYVSALLVKEPNLGYFLQRRDLSDEDDLTRVGRYVLQRKVELNLSAAQLNDWQRHSVDLSELVAAHPNALFSVHINATLADAAVSCSPKALARALKPHRVFADAEDSSGDSAWDSYGYYGYYWWSDNPDPCKPSYYARKSITHNFISSNIGLLAKEGKAKGRERFFVATDLLTGAPRAGARLTLYNYQNEALASVTTDADGFARLDLDVPAFYLRADHEGDIGVLKLTRSGTLPLTHFDVGGSDVREGIKGALYAERGVWRPGDEMFLTFVLQDIHGALSPTHPIRVSLRDPNNVLASRFVLRRAVGGFYPFTLSTPEDAVTGFWSVKVEVGDRAWTRALRVEHIMPNRLQVNLSFPKELLTRADFPTSGKLFSQWLHGAKARGLLSTVSATVETRRVKFDAFPEFTFSGAEPYLDIKLFELFKGRLDDEGRASFVWELPSVLSGDLQARLTTRVFEEGGGFSTEYSDVALSLHDRYVGVRLPKGDERGMLLTDTPHQVLIKTLSPLGEPRDGAPLEIKVFKLEWMWWWDAEARSVSRYMSDSYERPVQITQLNTERGEGEWALEIKAPEWGRYLLQVCELPAGHCAAKVFFVDWPGWAEKTDEREVSATRLELNLDAPEYTVGGVARLKLPPMPGGRALLSVEQGARLVSQRWVLLGAQETVAEIPVTEGMAPNVHLHVTALQPHQRANDLPLRLYGVKRMDVLDPKTHLAPLLEMPEEVRPESEVVMRVSEQGGSRMVYTLAVVDEGLLGLTRFRTPRLHPEFFARVGLSVLTWDLFDDVVGYVGQVERLLSIGGAEEITEDPDANKRRFPPVVRFMGPFELKAGETNEHRFTMPQYVGAVRAMLVAGRQGGADVAYGSTERSMRVRQPLMILANPPRVLGPSEELLVPVSVFATSPDLTAVELFAATSDPASSITPRELVSFEQPREQERLSFLRLKVGDAAGAQTLTLRAEGGGWVSGQRVRLPVRLANPPVSAVERAEVAPGASVTLPLRDLGLPGTLSGAVELSTAPRLHLREHLSYLIGYPHGCLEQTTSKAFPQLYLPLLIDLSEEQRGEVTESVAQGVARVRQLQAASGGFGYWPGEEPHAWGTSYVGHFLLEARRLGYHVPAEMLSSFVGYQQARAREWSAPAPRSVEEEEAQAYRLMTLSLARQPDLGSMNRLRQAEGLGEVARWLLARAYLLAGQRDAAAALAAAPAAPAAAPAGRAVMAGFHSRLRDLGIQLVSLVQLGEVERARAARDELLAALGDGGAHSTHGVASALLGLGAWLSADEGGAGGAGGAGFSFALRAGAEELQVQSSRALWSRPLTAEELRAGEVTLRNTSARPLYAALTHRGVARAGQERAAASELDLRVEFLNDQGAPAAPAAARQGEHLTVVLRVKNTSARPLGQLALTYGAPSGWEIENERLAGAAAPPAGGARAGGLYQDFRDDRVLSYFELKGGEERELRVRVIAAYAGRFYHPATQVEAMYEPGARALVPGFWAEVSR